MYLKVLQREATTRDYPQIVLDGLRLYEENGNLDFNIPTLVITRYSKIWVFITSYYYQ